MSRGGSTQSALANKFVLGASAGEAENMYIDGDVLYSTVGGQRSRGLITAKTRAARRALIIRGEFGAGVTWLVDTGVGTHEGRQQKLVLDLLGRDNPTVWKTAFHTIEAMMPTWRTIGIRRERKFEHRPPKKSDWGPPLVTRYLVRACDDSACFLTDYGDQNDSRAWLKLDPVDLASLILPGENDPDWQIDRVHRRRMQFAESLTIPRDRVAGVGADKEAVAYRVDGGPWHVDESRVAGDRVVAMRKEQCRDVRVEAWHLDLQIRLVVDWSVYAYFRHANP